jgi:hypothetical protein
MNKYLIHLVSIFILFSSITKSGYSQQSFFYSSQPSSVDGKDTFVRDLSPAVNYSFSQENTILAWTYSGAPMITRVLVDFDIAAIPTGSTILNAHLYMYNNPNAPSTSGQHMQLSGSNELVVSRINSPWDDQLVTWNNQPSISTNNQIQTPASSSAYQDYVFDVSALVQEMVDNPTNSHGFMLALQTEILYRSVIFGSSECVDPTNRPKLEIEFLRPTNSDPVSSLENQLSADQFNIYPNPASDIIYIENNSSTNQIKISILDVQGKEVFNNSYNSGEIITVNMANLNKGIYLVKLENGNSLVFKKVIKN